MKTALVTGGTRGIGKAIAKVFANNHYQVIITGTRPESEISIPVGYKYFQVNFSNKESTESFFEVIKQERIDVLINNAGINNIKYLETVTDGDYDELLGVNLKCPYFLCKIAADSMKKNGGGHIVNISSIMSVTSREKRSLYSSSKAGLVGMTNALSVELGQHNILVNCVSPGFTLTDLTKESLSQEEMDDFSSKIPLGRLATVEEMAKATFFVGSDDNSYMTGQNIIVDGGFTTV